MSDQVTGMWELVDGAPITDEGARHAVAVLSRLSSALDPDDQVGTIDITIGPRRWRYRQLPPMLLAMPDGGPVTAILGPTGRSDVDRLAAPDPESCTHQGIGLPGCRTCDPRVDR